MMADVTPSTSFPLAPSHVAALNASPPPAATRPSPEMHEVTASIHQVMESTPEPETNDGPGSPYVDPASKSHDPASKSHEQQENVSPSRGRTGSGRSSRPISRIISGGELSPLRILQDRPAPVAEEASASSGTASAATAAVPLLDAAKMPPPNLVRSPRKSSWPDSTRRFPVKVNPPNAAAAAAAGGMTSPKARPPVNPKPQHLRELSLDDSPVRNNEGLQKAMAILDDDEVSGLAASDDEGDEDVTLGLGLGLGDGPSTLGVNGSGRRASGRESLSADDTVMSTFSNFSAVPTPRANRASMPPQRTPRSSASGPGQDSGNNTTNLLLEFTEQLRFSQAQQQQSWGGHISPSRTTPNLAGGGGVAATPQRTNMMNLLDFDIPPMPTPRSIPTITPRELESLKSNFLSEISSLKASLSGKEAEAQSLKTAVGDAEKRVGTCMEQLREETTAREQAKSERDDWERRAREMESVLRKVKEEIVVGQRERDELDAKLEESNMRRDMAETMAQEAESKLAAMRAGKAAEAAMQGSSGEKRSSSPGSQNGEQAGPGGKALTPRDVEMAVEKVARELHALYKSKHTDKITALKRSYERRWEKKVQELEDKVEDLSRENEDIRAGRHATMTRIDPAAVALEEERKVKAAKDSAQISELNAEVEKLEAVIRTVQEDNQEMRKLLEQERVEKGELVQLAEEMMSMQQSFVANSGGGGGNAPPPAESRSNSGIAHAPSGITSPRPNRNSSGSAKSAGSSYTPGPHRPARRPSSAAATASLTAPPTPSRAQPSPPRLGHATPGRGISRLQAPGTDGPAPRSIARMSGLRAPGSMAAPKSNIGRPMSYHERKSGPLGGGGGGVAPRSGLMSSIEKMGAYKGH
ncbi:hypothetical protein RB597_004027 [Gaeumannomyces tritici]